MLYDTSVELTYKSYGATDESDAVYRRELLKVFSLEEFNLDDINNKMEALYKKMTFDEAMMAQLKENAGRMLSEDIEMGFMFAFSYDQFDTTHKYVCKVLQDEKRNNASAYAYC